MAENVYVYINPSGEKINNTIELLFYGVLLVHFFVYMTKIMFELSLGISRVINVLDTINLICIFGGVITKYVEVILKANFEVDFADDKTYVDFTIFISLELVNSYCITICSFFLPFKVLQWLAHWEFFTPAKTIINSFCRTIPGVVVYAIVFIILILCWACGFFIVLSPLYPEFGTFGETIFSMICRDLQMVA